MKKKSIITISLCLLLVVLTVGGTLAKYTTYMDFTFPLNIITTPEIPIIIDPDPVYGNFRTNQHHVHEYLPGMSNADERFYGVILDKDGNPVGDQLHDKGVGVRIEFDNTYEYDADAERAFIGINNLQKGEVYQITFNYEASGTLRGPQNWAYYQYGWKVINPEFEDLYEWGYHKAKGQTRYMGTSLENRWYSQDSVQAVHAHADGANSRYITNYNNMNLFCPMVASSSFNINGTQTDTFLAEDETMWLYLDYSAIADNYTSTHKISDIYITKLNRRGTAVVKHAQTTDNLKAYTYFGYTPEGETDFSNYKWTIQRTGAHPRFAVKPYEGSLTVGKNYLLTFDFVNDVSSFDTSAYSYRFGARVSSNLQSPHYTGTEAELFKFVDVDNKDYYTKWYTNPIIAGNNATQYYYKETNDLYSFEKNTTTSCQIPFYADSEDMWLIIETSSQQKNTNANYEIKNLRITEISDGTTQFKHEHKVGNLLSHSLYFKYTPENTTDFVNYTWKLRKTEAYPRFAVKPYLGDLEEGASYRLTFDFVNTSTTGNYYGDFYFGATLRDNTLTFDGSKDLFETEAANVFGSGKQSDWKKFNTNATTNCQFDFTAGTTPKWLIIEVSGQANNKTVDYTIKNLRLEKVSGDPPLAMIETPSTIGAVSTQEAVQGPKTSEEPLALPPEIDDRIPAAE